MLQVNGRITIIAAAAMAAAIILAICGALPAGTGSSAAKSGAGAAAKSVKAEIISLDKDRYRVTWLARERFDSTWSARWAVEGDATVKTGGGKLYVGCIKSGKVNAATIWCKRELPADLFVRFRAKVLPPEDDNAANLNVITHATESNGRPVIFGRSGIYTEYHKIPNYIVTLTGGVQPGWSRVRRDPGFEILHEADVRSEVGKEYQIAVAVQKGRIRYYVNGRRYHDVTDPSPLPAGRFAIRTWSTNAWWSDVEFGRLLPSQ